MVGTLLWILDAVPQLDWLNPWLRFRDKDITS